MITLRHNASTDEVPDPREANRFFWVVREKAGAI